VKNFELLYLKYILCYCKKLRGTLYYIFELFDPRKIFLSIFNIEEKKLENIKNLIYNVKTQNESKYKIII